MATENGASIVLESRTVVRRDLTIHDVAISALPVNLSHELPVWIDISPVHSGSIERQRDFSVLVDRDHAAGSAELSDLVDHSDARLFHGFAAIFHQRRNIM